MSSLGDLLRRIRSRANFSWLFEVDPRTLGLFRIALGLLLLWDVSRRFALIDDFYVDDGLLPRALVKLDNESSWRFSFFFWTGSRGGVALGMAFCAACYSTFALGLFTKWSHFLSLVCLVSLQSRTAIILGNGGDAVTCLMLLISLSLPLGSCFSLDRIRAKHRGASVPIGTVRGLGVFVLLLQLALIYGLNALQKGTVWLRGETVHWALWQDRMSTGVGVGLRELVAHHPWVGRVFTYLSLLLEALAPFAILSPWQRPWVRRMALITLIPMHVGFALTLSIGIFLPAMCTFLLLLIAANDWDWLRIRANVSWIPPIEPAAPRTRWVTHGETAFATLVLLVILSQLPRDNHGPKFTRTLKVPVLYQLGRVVRMYQGWRMFAPSPPRREFMMIVTAKNNQGEVFDPLAEYLGQGRMVRTEISPSASLQQLWYDYTNGTRWSRLYEPALRSWLLRRPGVVTLQVDWLEQDSPPIGQTQRVGSRRGYLFRIPSSEGSGL